MAVFEPDVVRNLCLKIYSGAQRTKEESRWTTSVNNRLVKWQGGRDGQSGFTPQLVFAAEACEYVNFLAKVTRPPLKSGVATLPLDLNIPLFGPRFVPPSFLQVRRRSPEPQITPDAAYLKPLNIVHPLYYPEILERCPRCRIAGVKSEIYWNGFNGTGHREVHGLMQEETAIGVQLRCKTCEAKFAGHSTGKGRKGEKNGEEVEEDSEENEKSVMEDQSYCFVTTSHRFWEKIEHWEIPAGMPRFFKRCALTSDLYDLIVELRPSVTAGGLAENIRQLHLLHYHKQRLAYLRYYDAARPRGQMTLGQTESRNTVPLRNFSKPASSGVATHVQGYDNRSISDDLISDVFKRFSEQTRQAESEENLRAKTAVTIALDATFRAASKATIVEKNKTRTKAYQGGIVAVINERGAVLSWRYCLGQSHVEVEEQLTGLSCRFKKAGVADPEVAVVDNCCHIRNAINKAFPGIAVVLDVWHFMMRYLICIENGTKNPHRAEVARDLVGAILKSTAKNKVPAAYWSKVEQESRLVAVYEKWAAKGHVWTKAAAKTHVEQLAHVQKGCLARPRDDIATDGSRIENVNRGFNRLQQSCASGLETMTALCHDYVHRRNARLEFVSSDPTPFVASTYGSHHTRLVHGCASLWNNLVAIGQRGGRTLPADIRRLPEFLTIDSGETFGAVKMSPAVAAQQSFVTIKEELDDICDLSALDLLNPAHVLQELGVDPALLHVPLPHASQADARPRATIAPVPMPQVVQAPTPGPSKLPEQDVTYVGKGKGKEVDRHLTVPQKRAIEDLDDGLIEMSEEDWNVHAITQRSSALSLDRSAFASSSPGPVEDNQGPTTYPLAPVVAASQYLATSSTPSPDVSSMAPAPVYTQRSLPLSAEEPPPKKKARLHVPGMPGRSSSSRNTSVSLQGSSGASTVAGSSTAAARLSSFFGPRRPEFHANSSVRPCVPAPTITGDTPSQRLFSIATGIDVRSLSFTSFGGPEFFLFMELRERYQWTSFGMSPFDWVTGTSVYNQELQALNARKGRAFVMKTPRALMEYLAKIETKILGRIASNDFMAKDTGKTDFWERHCYAVPLGSKSQSRGEQDGKKKLRFNHTCARCQKLMYPGELGADINHKKAYCSDGARQASRTVEKVINGQKTKIVDEPPMYPQPPGIFTAGTTFHPAVFLQEVRLLYERVILHKDAVTMQDLAFASMLHQRTLTLDATHDAPAMVLFKLYPSLKVDGTFPQHLLVDYDGMRYVHMNYLDDSAEGMP